MTGVDADHEQVGLVGELGKSLDRTPFQPMEFDAHTRHALAQQRLRVSQPVKRRRAVLVQTGRHVDHTDHGMPPCGPLGNPLECCHGCGGAVVAEDDPFHELLLSPRRVPRERR